MALALVDQEASKVLDGAARNNPPIKGIISIFVILELVYPSLMKHSESFNSVGWSTNNYSADDSEIADIITKLLEQINSMSEVPDSSPLIRVLKCVNQKVMFPPFHCLKQLLKL